MQSDSIAAVLEPGFVVRRRWQQSLLTFLMVFGPGLIVMEADNDAGAVSTYVQAGAQYGLHLLWILLLLPIIYFVQEMVARLGIATGKGHATMIYERFGKWWGRFSHVSTQHAGPNHKRPDLSHHRHRGNYDCSLATLLPTELRRGEAAAFCGFEMGTPVHPDCGDV